MGGQGCRGVPRGAKGCPGGVSERVGRAHAPEFNRCAKTIENISRIRNVVARASGMDLASILKRNTF